MAQNEATRRWMVAGLVVLLVAGLAAGAWWWAAGRQRITQAVLVRLADPRTRAAEARRLGQAGWREAVPHLAALLQVEAAGDRQAVVWALGAIGGPEAVKALERAAGDASTEVRVEAARALARAVAPLRLEGLGVLLADTQPSVRLEALRALPDQSDDPGVAQALNAAVRDPDVQVRGAAVEEAARQPAGAAVAALAVALSDLDPALAAAAAAQVARRRGELAAQALHQARGAAGNQDMLPLARVLRLTADAGMVTGLLDLLDLAGQRARRAPPAELLEVLTATLAKLGPPAAGPLAQETMLGERSDLAEQAAAAALERIGPAAAVPVAQGLLAWRIYPDVNELRRWVAVLAAVGDASPATAAALDRAASQSAVGLDQAVAEARRAIEERTGQSLPPPQPDPALAGGPPTAAAWTKIGGAPVPVARLGARATDLPDNGVVHLDLHGGINWSDQPGHEGASDLLLVMTRRGGEWEQGLVAYGLGFNKRIHEGRVLPATQPASAPLRVELVLHNDLWRHAAFAQYDITLRATAQGLAADYAGTCNDEPSRGAATVSAWPVDWKAVAPPPLAPGEHPRLLFRKAHYEQLRQRVRTPVGRAIFQALLAQMRQGKHLHQIPLDWVGNWGVGADQAIGHGFLARVYEDRRHGARAMDLVMPRTLQRPYQGEHGERLPAPMCIYPFAADLLFEDYTPRQREQVLDCAGHMRLSYSYRWGPIGVYAVGRGLTGIPALSSLMLVGEEGPMGLPKPVPPPPVVTLEGETPPTPQDPPPESFAPDRLLTRWLWAGRVGSGQEDPVTDLGGRAAAWIKDGDTFRHGGASYRFSPLPAACVRGLPGVPNSTYVFPPAEGEGRCLLYTVLKVDALTCIAVPDGTQLGHQGTGVYLGGQRIELDTVVILKPGLHRLLVEAPGSVFNARFPARRAGYATAQWKKHAWLQREYQAARERWQQTGQMQDMPYIHEMASHGCRTGLLTGTAGVRRDSRRGGELIWPLVAARWLCTGPGLPPDVPWDPVSDPQNAPPELMGDRELCFMMGAGPDDLRAGMAAEFRRRYLQGDQAKRLGCLELVAALVHYPMDLERPAAPQP